MSSLKRKDRRAGILQFCVFTKCKNNNKQTNKQTKVTERSTKLRATQHPPTSRDLYLQTIQALLKKKEKESAGGLEQQKYHSRYKFGKKKKKEKKNPSKI